MLNGLKMQDRAVRYTPDVFLKTFLQRDNKQSPADYFL